MFKVCSKENVLLGGIYMALGTPFIYANIEKVSSFLFLVFVLGLVIQCFKSNVFKLEQRLASYPRVSYYLCFIGWIPYFYILSLIMVFILSFLGFENNDIMGDVFLYISYSIVPLSLIVAYVWQRYKKLFS